MSGLVRDLFDLAFHGVPDWLDVLVPWDLAERERLAFKAGPILVLGGPGVPRAYVASVGEPEAFDARVAARWGPEAAAFLAGVPPEVRRMVDTDGRIATLYLDDLHASEPPRPGKDAVMCRTLRLPDGERTTITRHGPPPRARLAPAWQRLVDDAHHAGLAGIWCVRWRGDEVASLLWVDDSRWRGDPEVAARVIDRRGDAVWAALRARAAREGLRLYPDSVEIRADGAWEVTAGLAPG